MPASNSDIVRALSRLAGLLSLQDDNPYRARAYEKAARTIGELPMPLEEMLRSGSKLSDLPGIGAKLTGVIEEILATGSSSLLQEVEESLPRSLIDFIDESSLEPSLAHRLHKKHGIASVEALREALSNGKLVKLGKGALSAIQRVLSGESHRLLIHQADQLLGAFMAHLDRLDLAGKVSVTGALRRREETIDRLTILVRRDAYDDVVAAVTKFGPLEKITEQREERTVAVLQQGLELAIEASSPESFGTALLRATGTTEFVEALEAIAAPGGLPSFPNELELFSALSLPFIEPELRKEQAILEAGRKGKLPRLIRLEDMRGDLHSHTTASDGAHSLEEMARAAVARGYEYLSISDHSQRLKIARGLTPERLHAQMDEIDALNRTFDGFRLLKSSECDILDDGSLDLPDEVLSRLDLVVCSIHSRFALPKEAQTERLIRAIRNPLCAIIGHPTGRLLLSRAPYDLDIERVLDAARDASCILEINANPHRLDLSDSLAQRAKELGIKIAISTDAHHTEELDFMNYGIGQARRAGLEASDVVNTLPLDELLDLVSKKRTG